MTDENIENRTIKKVISTIFTIYFSSKISILKIEMKLVEKKIQQNIKKVKIKEKSMW